MPRRQDGEGAVAPGGQMADGRRQVVIDAGRKEQIILSDGRAGRAAGQHVVFQLNVGISKTYGEIKMIKGRVICMVQTRPLPGT